MHCSRISRVTMVFSGVMVPLVTAISSTFKAVRASPLANAAMAAISSSPISTFRYPRPLELFNAWWRSSVKSSVERGWRTKTRHRDKRAALISKDGFSVVAPMRMMLPFST